MTGTIGDEVTFAGNSREGPSPLPRKFPDFVGQVAGRFRIA
jgi:hypothetical protein